MITPNDIATKTFKKVTGGYSPEEVDSFLDDIYEDYERLYEESLKPKIAPAVVPTPKPQPQIKQELPAPPAIDPKELAAIQKALEKTLILAEQTAAETKDSAMKESNQIIKEAKLQAEEIIRSTRSNQFQLEQEIMNLESRYELMCTRIRLLLNAEIELLDKHEMEISKKSSKQQKK